MQIKIVVGDAAGESDSIDLCTVNCNASDLRPVTIWSLSVHARQDRVYDFDSELANIQ